MKRADPGQVIAVTFFIYPCSYTKNNNQPFRRLVEILRSNNWK